MEKFVKDTKQNICFDFCNQELKDIKIATEILLKRFCDSVGQVNPLFEVNALVPCGSMDEETRNWKFTGPSQEPVIEFDFLAVLKNPAQSEITTIKHCHKFMQVIDEYDCLGHYKLAAVEPENALQVDSIAKFFQEDLLKSVSRMCDCSSLRNEGKIKSRNNEKESACRKCCESVTSGYLELALDDGISSRPLKNCSLVLKWTSKSRSLCAPLPDASRQKQLDHVYILVSLLPSFELVKENQSELNDTCSNEVVSTVEHDCFLVPKTCSNKHPTCWKVSNCFTEIRLLQNTSQEHRYMYMIVKFLSKCLFSGYHMDGSLPSTYKIKTAVLHHIKACSCSDLSTCVRQLLRDLSDTYSKQTLPDYVSGFNLLSANKSENLPTQNHPWHENRCKLVSDCFSFVCHFFDNVLDAEGLSLDSAIKVLQFIGRTYYTAWRQTEIEPVYDVNKEYLKSKLIEELDKSESFVCLEDVNYEDLVIKRACSSVHWTRSLRVWEYAAVREMYAFHQFDCPDPPGRTPGREENILLQAQMTCDFFSWPHEDQQEWMEKLAHSENPDNIVAALKAVDMSSAGVRVRKGFNLPKKSLKNQRPSRRDTSKQSISSETR